MLEFVLKGEPLKLMAFVEPGATTLFVPFSDLTSGTETYPAGRFMDLTPSANDIYVVDFNRAYIPYCYYNFTYECPIPPQENRLQIPVRAGERFGVIRLYSGKRLVVTRPLVASRSIDRPGVFGRVGFYAGHTLKHIGSWFS